MMGYDLIRPDMERHGAFRMTQKARPILRGEETIELRKDTVVKTRGARTRVKAMVADEDEALLSALKAKRRALAEAMQAPAYVVFPDATLIAMAEARPKNIDGFAKLPGVGAVKLKRYAAPFLEVINGAAEDVHPARRKLAGRDAGELFDRLQAAQVRLRPWRKRNGYVSELFKFYSVKDRTKETSESRSFGADRRCRRYQSRAVWFRIF